MSTSSRLAESRELSQERVFQADLTWTGDRFEEEVQVVADGGGLIREVGRLGRTADVRLQGKALLPGFVNAHSHAFQRGLRGRGETFPRGKGSFWTWREEMYRLVDSMDGERLLDLCQQAYGEMLAAGITCVGEFHYLHHDASGAGYAFDEVVLEAARRSGIRIVLLNAFYRWGGPGRPLEGAQKRFATSSMDQYWRQMERLRQVLTAGQSLGTVAHSLRAVDLEEAVQLREEARRQGLPFHIHVEEQPREIEECLEHYGARPLALINRRLQPDPSLTAVHCTHSSAEDMKPYLEAGGGVLICPLTEANLGDGIADLPLIGGLGGRIALGSDSNARICMLEEARWLEYVQRLARQSRGILRATPEPPSDSGRSSLDDDRPAGEDGATIAGDNAACLLRCATLEGARSLSLPAGEIAPGRWADFCAVDLSHPDLAGTNASTLLPALLLGCGNSAIHSTYVSGSRRFLGG
ncbi:MAG TPA: formimidoylglutamate deiminase [Acidobacteriota bacterium]|nr:formimidoylglutamate deiminase [Acidobacteriota bacterium]